MFDETGRAPCHPDFAKYLDGRSMHRDDASAILEYIGVNSPAGNYPPDIPPYLIGRAVWKLLSNYCTKVSDDGVLIESDNETIRREFLAGFFKLKL